MEQLEPALRTALSAAMTEIEASGGRWFTSLNHGPIRARVAERTVRTRCGLFKVELTDGVVAESVMVKVRRPTKSRRAARPRPTLMPAAPLPEPEMTRLEFDGLRQIETRLGDAEEERWSVLRPLAMQPEHSMLVMDHVSLPTLRSVLMAGSRIPVGLSRRTPGCVWSNAGAWLRAYHDTNPHEGAAVRNGDRTELMATYGVLVDYLRRHVPDRKLLDELAQRIEHVVSPALPADLDLVRGHGDFTARNILVGPTGAVTVLDPMPRWLIPPQKDLAQFLVGMRLLGLQVASQGMAFGPRHLERIEQAVLGGYYGAGPVAVATITAFELLILLDNWSALVSRSGAAFPSRVVLRWFSRYYEVETKRLVRSLTRETPHLGLPAGRPRGVARGRIGPGISVCCGRRRRT